MDTSEYIKTGIIEAFVLGEVTDQERREVECLSKIYPEIKEEIFNVSQALESYAKLHAVEPPKELRSKIYEQVKKTPQDTARIIPINSNELPSKSNLWIAAASLAVLLVSSVFHLVQYNEQQAVRTDLAQTKKELDKTTQRESNLRADLNSKIEREQFVVASDVDQVLLSGTNYKPNAVAKVYWKKNSGEVLLNISGLDQPKKGNQYQLWALTDDQPKSLGVISLDETWFKTTVQELAVIGGFAITEEQFGGSESPTLDQLCVIHVL